MLVNIFTVEQGDLPYSYPKKAIYVLFPIDVPTRSRAGLYHGFIFEYRTTIIQWDEVQPVHG